jgi:hypothetical protein
MNLETISLSLENYVAQIGNYFGETDVGGWSRRAGWAYADGPTQAGRHSWAYMGGPIRTGLRGRAYTGGQAALARPSSELCDLAHPLPESLLQ